MTILNVTQQEGAWNKKESVFEISIKQEGLALCGRDLTISEVIWTVFRRYAQVNELDSKLKSHGLLKRSDNHLPSKFKWRERCALYLYRGSFLRTQQEKISDLHTYFNQVLNQPEIRKTQYVFNFVGPFQIGDISPNRNTRDSWVYNEESFLA